MYVVDSGVGNPGIIGIVPAVGGVIAGAAEKARIESHIQDRMKQWAGMSVADLQTILPRGGEAAEAARRLIAQKSGGAVQAPAAGPLIDLSKILKLPEVTTTSTVTIPPTVWYGLAAVAAVGLLMFTMRKR